MDVLVHAEDEKFVINVEWDSTKEVFVASSPGFPHTTSAESSFTALRDLVDLLEEYLVGDDVSL